MNIGTENGTCSKTGERWDIPIETDLACWHCQQGKQGYISFTANMTMKIEVYQYTGTHISVLTKQKKEQQTKAG